MSYHDMPRLTGLRVENEVMSELTDAGSDGRTKSDQADRNRLREARMAENRARLAAASGETPKPLYTDSDGNSYPCNRCACKNYVGSFTDDGWSNCHCCDHSARAHNYTGKILTQKE